MTLIVVLSTLNMYRYVQHIIFFFHIWPTVLILRYTLTGYEQLFVRIGTYKGTDGLRIGTTNVRIRTFVVPIRTEFPNWWFQDSWSLFSRDSIKTHFQDVTNTLSRHPLNQMCFSYGSLASPGTFITSTRYWK